MDYVWVSEPLLLEPGAVGLSVQVHGAEAEPGVWYSIVLERLGANDEWEHDVSAGGVVGGSAGEVSVRFADALTAPRTFRVAVVAEMPLPALDVDVEVH